MRHARQSSVALMGRVPSRKFGQEATRAQSCEGRRTCNHYKKNFARGPVLEETGLYVFITLELTHGGFA